MKATVIFLGFDSSHLSRDPGVISRGLMDSGITVDLVTKNKPELAGCSFPFNVVVVEDEKEFADAEFWNKNDSDFVIFYTWIGAKKFYYDVILAIKKSGKFLIIKSDSDGKLAFPLSPSLWKVFLNKRSVFGKIKLFSAQFLPFRFLHRWRLGSIRMADAIIIELPQSYVNLERYMRYWGCINIFHKVFIIPNPLSGVFLDAQKDNPVSKQNIICSVGRWDAPIAKNTKVLVKSIVGFLKSHPNFEAVIIGGGHEAVQKQIRNESQDILSRIMITGPIPQSEIREYFLKSKIYFLASRWESFSLSSVEALSSGCSIVSTPIDVEKSLTLGGFCGTLAASSCSDSLTSALSIDVLKWEQGFYSPEEISDYWKKKLDGKNIARQIIRIYESRK